MWHSTIKTWSVICSIMVISLIVNVIYVYKNPAMMVEDMVLAAVQQLPLLACLVSAVLFAIAALSLKVQWKFIIPTILLSTLLSFVGVVAVSKIPGSSDWFLTMYRHQDKVYNNNPVILQAGKVTPNVLSNIRDKLPQDVSLYVVDGTEYQRGFYWVVAIDNRGQPEYKISIFNSANNWLSPGVSLENIWRKIQLSENLPQSVIYTTVSGLPMRENGNSSVELQRFVLDRTLHFHTGQGKTYSVTLSTNGEDVTIHQQ